MSIFSSRGFTDYTNIHSRNCCCGGPCGEGWGCDAGQPRTLDGFMPVVKHPLQSTGIYLHVSQSDKTFTSCPVWRDTGLGGSPQSRAGGCIRGSAAGRFQQDEHSQAVSRAMVMKQHRQRHLYNPLKDQEVSKRGVWDTFTLEGVQ